MDLETLWSFTLVYHWRGGVNPIVRFRSVANDNGVSWSRVFRVRT
jgi:hypothetical protein